ncbi:uncharacterized protein LY89DRAFT_430020 [Mollisia scopiformis]|uniref:Uncharacterized protein n=1 Tax=Mollisia scopiformis TaxID=149040 RepID=A0A194XMB7_MOLSC|nr:uncharacterized protein LY89DRAFT_430020 [Mollisia scopiformis]KUJ21234.1 hypothetical protein LY89DRAFT_430020 [Mollisia scopiformis]
MRLLGLMHEGDPIFAENENALVFVYAELWSWRHVVDELSWRRNSGVSAHLTGAVPRGNLHTTIFWAIRISEDGTFYIFQAVLYPHLPNALLHHQPGTCSIPLPHLWRQLPSSMHIGPYATCTYLLATWPAMPFSASCTKVEFPMSDWVSSEDQARKPLKHDRRGTLTPYLG